MKTENVHTHTEILVDILANHNEVTGSCHLVIVKFPNRKKVKFIIDLGLVQEKDHCKYNQEDLPFNVQDIKFTALTHGHIDHIGDTPRLCALGYENPVYCTEITEVIAEPSLHDSYRISKRECRRNGIEMKYCADDIDELMKLIEVKPLEKTFDVYHNNISLTFLDNGHIPGASMILVKISYPGCAGVNLLFTGDYSPHSMFFDVRPLPEFVKNMPLTVITEATYGQMSISEIEEVFIDNLIEAIKKGKTVICPVFSLDRGQEIAFMVRKAQDAGLIPKDITVWLDGSLFRIHTNNIYLNLKFKFKDGIKDFLPYNCEFVENKEQRKMLQMDRGVKIILTSSGMGSYGPAPGYLQSFVPYYNALIHFTGYAAEGTVARNLKDAVLDSFIKIGGILVNKRAQIEHTNEFSAHAKKEELLALLSELNNIQSVLINHGNTDTKEYYAKYILEEGVCDNVGIEERGSCFQVGYDGIKFQRDLEENQNIYA